MMVTSITFGSISLMNFQDLRFSTENRDAIPPCG